MTIGKKIKSKSTFSALLLLAVTGYLLLQASLVLGAESVPVSVDQSAISAASFSIDDVMVTEGAAGTVGATFTVSRDDNTVTDTVDIVTMDGTATAGTDYVAVPSTTLTFTAGGPLTQTVTVLVNGDSLVEADETFSVVLSNAGAAAIADGTGVGTIPNDDSAVVSIVASQSAAENSGPMTFNISLSNPVDAAVSVLFNTNDAGATAGSDYTAVTNQTVTFAANSTTNQQVSVTLTGDSAIESNEFFDATIGMLTSGGRNVSLGTVTRSGLILNDDTANLTLTGDAPQDEGDGLTPTIYTFTATLSKAVPGGFSVAYATQNGTATLADGDYAATSGSLVFTGTMGESKTFTVTVNPDNQLEPNETFRAGLGAVSGTPHSAAIVKVGNPRTATILNDDTAIVSLAGDTAKFEGASGTTSYVFTGTLNVDVAQSFSVPISVTNGTATAADGDYVYSGPTHLTFAGNAGETQTITVLVNGDTKVEADETFQVVLGSAEGTPLAGSISTLGTPQTATIENDDSAVITLTGVTAQAEGNSGTTAYTFKATLNRAVQGGLQLAYSTNNGTATTADGDYQDDDGSLTFDGTAGEEETITILVNGDAKVEPNETFVVNLGAISGTALSANISLGDSAETGTITNDDKTTVTISGPVATDEGDSGTTAFTFDVTLADAVQGGFAIAYATSNGTATAGSDYASKSGSLAFSGTAGEVKQITVVVNGDSTVENNETFTVGLGAFSGTALAADLSVAGSPATGMITNDDGAVFTIALASNSVVEANTTVKATVTMNNPSSFVTTVKYATTGITATAGSDFQSASGTLTFAPNETVKTFDITILNDAVSELDELISVGLSDAVNATIGNPGSAILTIIDDDGLPSVSIGGGTFEMGESGPSIPVTITLNRTSSLPVTVLLSSVDDTAVAPADYPAVNQSVTIPAGTRSKVVQISPAADTVYERDETFTLKLSGYVNGEPGTRTEATVTILEDDAAPSISISNGSAAETDALTTLSFTVKLSKAADVPISVNYTTQDGTATVADSDYVAASGTLVIPAGQTSADIDVSINGDSLGEEDETFGITLSAPSDGAISTSTATGTITNDDLYVVMLPLVTNGRAPGPDLVVTKIESTNGQVAVTISNVGNQAANGFFWVDLFVDPTIMPTKPNDTVDSLGQQGIVWLVGNGVLPFLPGQTVVLTIGVVHYRPGETNFSGNIPAGTPLAVHVDSANVSTSFGAIEEGHETSNGTYNNIASTTVAADVLIP